jgi:tubulin polyglutamylase TTLL5
MRAPSDLQKLLCFQRINFFIGDKHLTRKDYLKRALERIQKLSARTQSLFNIMPLTFILPKEYVDFLTVFSEIEDQVGEQNNFWTMKAAQARGQPTQLVNDVTQIKFGEAYLLQQYIRKPLLVRGYKFDLRLFVLVTSVNPLEAFLYQEGFA